MDEKEIVDLVRKTIKEELSKLIVHQSMIVAGAVKERHIDLDAREQGDIIYVDSEKRLKLLNAGTSGGALITGGADADPAYSTPDTGWAVINKNADKTLDCNVGDTLVTSDVLGTLIDVLISVGIISA